MAKISEMIPKSRNASFVNQAMSDFRVIELEDWIWMYPIDMYSHTWSQTSRGSAD